MRAVLYFLITNLAVLILASLVFSVLFQFEFFQGMEGSLGGLLIFCAIFGMLGSFISLFLSKKIAKWSSKTRIIKTPETATEKWLVNAVHDMADREGIGHPEVGIFPSPAPNAFATGWNRDNALVAVSEGLLQQMSKEEVEAVLAHEVGHITNGDMLIMTMIQGVLNTFVMFFARIFGFAVDAALRQRDERGGTGIGFFIGTIVAEIFLGLLASLIVFWFSRQREFRADAKAAELTSHDAMISALKRLQVATVPAHAQSGMPESMKAMGISSGKRIHKASLFSTHPPLEQRIAVLEQNRR